MPLVANPSQAQLAFRVAGFTAGPGKKPISRPPDQYGQPFPVTAFTWDATSGLISAGGEFKTGAEGGVPHC